MMFSIDPNTQDIRIPRGDGRVIPYAVTDENDAVVDITGDTFLFTVKKSIDDLIGAAIFQKATGGNGIIITPPGTNGLFEVTILSTDIAGISGRHVFDIERAVGGGDPQTIVGPSLFLVVKDVTTPGVAPSPTPPLQAFADISISGFRYIKDAVDGLWYKYQHRNGTMVIVDAQVGPPPF